MTHARSKFWIASVGVLCLLLPALGQPAMMLALPGERWAVIISIDASSPDSKPAAVEAIGHDLAATLRSSYGYQNIVELSGAEATQEKIFRLRDDLRYRVKPGDSVLIVVLTEWIALSSGEVALLPADGVPSQSWTLLKLADLTEMASGIRAASVAVVLDRCVRSEIESYANQAQMSKGGAYTSARNRGVIVTGCVRSSGERGQFVKKMNQALKEFSPTPSGPTLTLSQLLNQVTNTRALVDVDVQDYSGGLQQFNFTHAGSGIDPALEARIRNRSGSIESRQDALSALAGIVAQEKADSPLASAAGNQFEQIAMARDEDEGLRIAAVRHLGRLQYARAVPISVDLSGDESNPPNLRIAALEALTSFGPEAAHDSIMKALSASNADVRTEAIAQFRNVSNAADAEFLLQRLEAEPDAAAQLALVQTAVSLEIPAEKLLPALNQFIASPKSTDARSEAIRAVGRLGQQESLPALEKILSDDLQPAAVRQNAAYAIGKLKYTDPAAKTQAAELTAQFMKAADPGVRRGVADTLGRLQVASTRMALEQLARDGDISVREVAVPALGQFHDPASGPLLERIVLKDSSPVVRSAAARALGELGQASAAKALAIAANDKDPAVRRAAAESLKRFEGTDDSVMVLLQSVYQKKDPHEKARAIRLLPAKDDSQVIAALVSTLEIEDREVRAASLDKLGQTPGTEVVRQLVAALASRDDDTREGAVLALGRIGERVEPGSPQWQPALKALANMPPDGDTDVRIAVARTAGSFADPIALNIILGYSKDEERLVRVAAADGMRALAANYARLRNPIMAIDAGERAVELRKQLVGEKNVETATEYNNLGAYHLLAETWRDAEFNLQRALEIREGILGSYDLDTGVSLANLATLYQRTGDLKRAEPLFQRVLTIRERALPPSDPAVIQTLENLSAVYTAMGDQERAEKYRQLIKNAQRNTRAKAS